MRGRVFFLGGLAAGFVIGARSGRASYEKMVETARKVQEYPTVQEAAGLIQAQVTRLGAEARRLMQKCPCTCCGQETTGSSPADDAETTPAADEVETTALTGDPETPPTTEAKTGAAAQDETAS